MPENGFLTHAQLKTSNAAAIAGIAFWLLRTSISADPLEPARACHRHESVTVALNLVPFAAIAFLWFIGVLRDRLAQLENRFSRPSFSGAACCFWRCCSLRPPS